MTIVLGATLRLMSLGWLIPFGPVNGVGFDDCATVFKTGQHTCVRVKCYDDVLVTDEFAPNDPTGGHQRKFYAPGVGNIKVSPVGGTNPETLSLIKAARLGPSDFASFRRLALAQDGRSYIVAPDVFGRTPHARVTLDAQTRDE